MRSSRSALVAAALLGAIAMPGGVAAEAMKAPPPMGPRRADARRMVLDAQAWGRSTRSPGPGWTFAQVKRMAKKRRNVLRNRRAHRGGRK